MTQHITQEVADRLAGKAHLEAARTDLSYDHALCNAAIQSYIDQQTKELPVLPRHPEPRTMKWSASEIEAIQAYGQQCAAHAREMALSEAAKEATDMGLHVCALAIEALKGK